MNIQRQTRASKVSQRGASLQAIATASVYAGITIVIGKLQTEFREGTLVIVHKGSRAGMMIFAVAEVVGTVVGWRHETTGAWYSERGDPSIPNKNGKLQLLRLMLRKADGEITDIVIDDLTKIAKLEK